MARMLQHVPRLLRVNATQVICCLFTAGIFNNSTSLKRHKLIPEHFLNQNTLARPWLLTAVSVANTFVVVLSSLMPFSCEVESDQLCV